MSPRKVRITLVGLLVVTAATPASYATFHLMQIEQVIGGVNGDVTAQAIQLRMRSGFQNFVSAARIRAWDANGMNPVMIIDMTSNVMNGNLGDRVLITSPGFPGVTTPTAMPDFTMTNLIPPSYLAAGSLTFESDTGIIYWRLSWGGASYTGSTTGSITNDIDGDFGPPFPGPLPTMDTRALVFLGSASAMSTTNAADYDLTVGDAVFTNNAGVSFTVGGGTPTGACCDDATGTCNEGVTQADCEGGGGRYGGDNSTCMTIDPACVEPTGACCFETTGICDEGLLQGDCESAGGRFGGIGSTCATIDPACPPPPLSISLETVAEGLTSPIYLTHAGDGSGRLFVVDQIGLIRVIKDGVLLPTPFLDLRDRIVEVNPVFDERGLLGLAFHPDYANNGRFFVRYSRPRAGAPDEPCNDPNGFIVGCHEAVLAEFSVLGDPTTSNLADPTSERILFTVDEPQFNHNAGTVAFGPDGLLYFSLGDGGGANDSLDDPNLPHGPIGNGQNIDTPLGAILRIDVDSPPDPGLPYAIPPDNPFVGVPGLDEIYAFGFRNPYRFSFDDGPGGDGALFVGDVGQDLFEEIDVVSKGGNYGWAIREGLHCFDPFNPTMPPASCASVGPVLGDPLLDPVLEYDHSLGTAVIGGFVYRGSAYPPLAGRYVFGDFSRDFGPTGQLFYTDLTGPDAFRLRRFRIAPDLAPLGLAVKGLGEDEEGELYVLASPDVGPAGSGGMVLKITPPRPGIELVSSRYLAVVPPPGPEPFALLVSADCPGGPVGAVATPDPSTRIAVLTDPGQAVFQTAVMWGNPVAVTGVGVTPDTPYRIQTVWTGPAGQKLSPPTVARTSGWGDVVGSFNGTDWNPPDGSVDIVTDALALIESFRQGALAPPLYRVDLVGAGPSGVDCLPDGGIDITIDAVAVVDAFRGRSYTLSTGCATACP